jgi:hypothetical protein
MPRQIALLGEVQAAAHAQIGPRPRVHRHMFLQRPRVADPDPDSDPGGGAKITHKSRKNIFLKFML